MSNFLIFARRYDIRTISLDVRYYRGCGDPYWTDGERDRAWRGQSYRYVTF